MPTWQNLDLYEQSDEHLSVKKVQQTHNRASMDSRTEGSHFVVVTILSVPSADGDAFTIASSSVVGFGADEEVISGDGGTKHSFIPGNKNVIPRNASLNLRNK
jgi:hypothetical protein